MTDSEMVELIRSELDRPVDNEEATWYGAQCASDYAQVYVGRIERILREEDPKNYRGEE